MPEHLNQAIIELRQFFKSDLWKNAKQEDQPIISNKGILTSKTTNGITISLDTKINLAMELEGNFNDLAHKYMIWRKEQGLIKKTKTTV